MPDLPKLADPRLRDHRLAREQIAAELQRRYDAIVADRDDLRKVLAAYDEEIKELQALLHRGPREG